MPKLFRIRNQTAETVELDILGDIGWWGFSSQDCRDLLKSIAKDSKIKCHVFSGGGDTAEGFEIFNLLKAHPGGVEMELGALCASIATVIAMAGSPVKMAANGLFMIHNPWAMIQGDSEELRKNADTMDKIKDSIVGAYKSKTGLSEKELSDMMDEESWLSATEAKAKGFVDEIVNDDAAGEAEIQNHLRFQGFKNSAKLKEFFQARASKQTGPEGPNASGNVSGPQAEPEKTKPKPKNQSIVDQYMNGKISVFNSILGMSGAMCFHDRPDEGSGGPGTPEFETAVKAEAKKLIQAKIARDAEIKSICDLFAKKTGKTFSKLRDQAIAEDWTPDAFRGKLLTADDSEADAPAPKARTQNGAIVGSGYGEIIEPLDALKGTPGFAFVTSGDFRAAADIIKRGHSIKSAVAVETPRFSRNDTRTPYLNVTGTTLGPASIEILPGVVEQALRPLTVEDLLASGSTDNMSVHYIRQTLFTNAAGTVAETGTLTQSDFTFETVSADVQAVGNFIPVPEQMAADFPALASLINTQLPYMVDRAVEDQLASGDGTGTNLEGFLTVAGLQTVDIGSLAQTSATALDLALRMLTKIRWQYMDSNKAQAGWEPDGYIIHPTDWEFLTLMKDAVGQFYRTNPFAVTDGEERLWGKRVAVSPVTAQSTIIAGAFKTGGQVFNRQGMLIEMTNSDGTNFQKRILTIRACRRLALATYRPGNFCQGTGVNPQA